MIKCTILYFQESIGAIIILFFYFIFLFLSLFIMIIILPKIRESDIYINVSIVTLLQTNTRLQELSTY